MARKQKKQTPLAEAMDNAMAMVTRRTPVVAKIVTLHEPFVPDDTDTVMLVSQPDRFVLQQPTRPLPYIGAVVQYHERYCGLLEARAAIITRIWPLVEEEDRVDLATFTDATYHVQCRPRSDVPFAGSWTWIVR